MYSQTIKRIVPMADWLPRYAKSDLPGDVIAGGIVAVMLVPQAMAYAMLAGLPPMALTPAPAKVTLEKLQ